MQQQYSITLALRLKREYLDDGLADHHWLARAGFQARKPKGSFFLYVRAPKAAVKKDGGHIAFLSAEEVSQWLIAEKLISTVPWDDVGAYLRFSVTFAAPTVAEEARIVGTIGDRLGDVRFEF